MTYSMYIDSDFPCFALVLLAKSVSVVPERIDFSAKNFSSILSKSNVV